MTEHEQGHDDRVEDLDVPESESDEVKGGLQFTGKHLGDKMSKFDQKFSKDSFGQKLNPGSSRFGDGSV